jgi:hypothetical protein
MGAQPCALVPVSRSRLWSVTGYILLPCASIFSIVLLFRLSPAPGLWTTLLAFLLMALPGVFVGMAVFGWNFRRQPESLIFGVPLGLMLSGYVALMLGYLARWSPPLITIALLIMATLTGLWALRRRRAPLIAGLRPWTSADYSTLAGMGLVVLGFVAIPFSRVGELTTDGQAYTWLFGYDFVLRAAYAASITMGLPIDHIHMAGVPLHMYLVGYVLPAFAYSLCGETVHLHAILLVTEVLFDLVFLGCLFAFWRLFAKSAKALLITAILALIGYSYYGWLAIAQHFAKSLPPSLATKLQGQFAFGDVSHLLQRLFMIEPQAILALTIFLFVLTIVLSSDRRPAFAVNCLLGLAIGVEFGIDSWLGLTLAAWFAGVELMRLWAHWGDRDLWFQFLLVAAIAMILWASFFIVGMVGFSSGGLVSVRPYWWGLKFGILQYAIEYGPMLALGLLGLRSLWHRSRFQALSLGLIAALAVFQDLFVGVADLPHFRIGNRLLPLVFLAGAAWLFENTKFTPALKWSAFGAIVLAVPTFFTDIHGASNIRDRYHTDYVRSADLEACEWIRTHLPHTAIVQGKPGYIGDYQLSRSLRGEKELSLIPAFAFRRSALGAEYTASSMCAGCKEIARLREFDLDNLFRTQDLAAITTFVAKYKIDYLYVGPYEENQNPNFLNVLKTSPRFEEVYNRKAVHIFRIADTSLVANEELRQ